MIHDRRQGKKRRENTLNSAKLIVLRKINFSRHKDDTDRTQTERGCSRRQLFRHYCGSSALRYNSLDPQKRVPAHSIKSSNTGPSAMSLSKFQSISLCVVCRHFICTRKFI